MIHIRHSLIGLCIAVASVGVLAQGTDEHKDHHPADAAAPAASAAPGPAAALPSPGRAMGSDDMAVMNRQMQAMHEKMAAAKKTEARKTNRAGISVTELSKEQKAILKISNGVLVEETTGAAARSGIQSGDVIIAVNNQEVNTAEELARLLDDPSRKSVALLVKRGDNAHYVSLRLDK